MGLSNSSKLRILQLVNILVSLAVIIFAIIFFIGMPFSIPQIIMNIYLIGFAVLLILAELKINKVYIQMAFLKYFLGRALFMIFLGTLTLDGMNVRSLFGLIFIILGVFQSIFHSRLNNMQLENQQKYQQPQQ